MRTINFELNDHAGQPHSYAVTLFTCDENVRFQLKLSVPVLEVVGRAIGAIAPAVREGAIDAIMKGDAQTVASALSHINWLTAPAALGPLPKIIEESGGAGFIAEIFAHTIRKVPVPEAQGAPTAGREIDPNLKQHLSVSADRDQAYGDGNFAEYWATVVMVLVINFTQLGRIGSANLKQAVDLLTFGILTRLNEGSETAAPSNDSGIGNA